MRGLLYKDLYTILKQMKIVLLVIVIWSLIPGFSAYSFAVFYAGMLPVTAMAYDERSKWNQLAVMMPYSVKSLVFSKYVLGYILVGCAAVVTAAANLIIAPEPENFTALLIMTCLSLVFLAVNLPAMFALGVEKGRYVFYLLVAAVVAGGMVLGDKLAGLLANLSLTTGQGLAYAAAVTVVMNFVSVQLSVYFQKNKQ